MEQNRKLEILKETAKEYIEKYPERVNQFRKEFEVDENDYIERDIDFFEMIHIWLTDTGPYSEDWSYKSSDNYKIALKLAEQIGNEKICFALMAKIRFLVSKTFTPIKQADVDTRDLTPQRTETKTEQAIIEMKPVLKPEAVQIVFDIIKDFFSAEQQTELKQILETGNKASPKLLFMDNANRLTDTFKKLIEHDFITGCQKQHLESWIVSNFLFLHNGTPKDFKPKVVNKYVSAGEKTIPCKSPLIEIIDGQIRKAEQPRTKKYSKY